MPLDAKKGEWLFGCCCASFNVGVSRPRPGASGTKSEIVEELDKAIEAATAAQEIFTEVGDRVGTAGEGVHCDGCWG